MSFDKFKAIPQDGGASELTRPDGAAKSGQGKRSAEEMEFEDKSFLAEKKAELKEMVPFDTMPCENEASMREWCKNKIRSASALSTKIGAKLTSLKRRKDGASSAISQDLVEVQSTTSAFQQLFSELSSDNPYGSQLKELMAKFSDVGFQFNRLVNITLIRSVVMDDLRFGIFSDHLGCRMWVGLSVRFV